MTPANLTFLKGESMELKALPVYIPDPGMRLCRGCGGSGVNAETWQGGDLVYPFEFCPACGGDGQFSDRMPRADAMADAETLIRFASDLVPYSGSSLGNEEWQVHNIGESARHAYSAVEWGLAPYVPGRTEGAKTRKRSERVRTYSSMAARAAFRAVPGLRGE